MSATKATPTEAIAMTYVITETCIDVKDKSCVDVCPVDCIHGSDDDRMLYIDPSECIDCGACIDPCPVDAIYAEEDVPPDQQAYLEINRQYFTERQAARRRVDELRPSLGSDDVRSVGSAPSAMTEGLTPSPDTTSRRALP
jgi:NAD-dependent dihydropyrimidine dehydrogenase PreA subunit